MTILDALFDKIQEQEEEEKIKKQQMKAISVRNTKTPSAKQRTGNKINIFNSDFLNSLSPLVKTPKGNSNTRKFSAVSSAYRAP